MNNIIYYRISFSLSFNNVVYKFIVLLKSYQYMQYQINIALQSIESHISRSLFAYRN